MPLDDKSGETLVLRRREGCPVPQSMVGRTSGKDKVSTDEYKRQEDNYEEEKKENGVNATGYLIGRHRECGTSWLQQLL